MYITALLFFKQFHKLPDSIGEEAVRLFPNPCRHRFFSLLCHCQTSNCMMPFKWTEGMKVAWCKVKNFMVGVAEP